MYLREGKSNFNNNTATRKWRRFGSAISLVLSLLIITLSPLYSYYANADTLTAGDLAPRSNPDGMLNAADLLILQQFVLGKQTPVGNESLIADVAPLNSPDGQLNAGDIVIMDNLQCHKNAYARKLIEEVGAQIWYLPAYSPDYNPIEKMWSKIKAFIRKVGARTQELLYKAIADALATITQSDIHGWFKSCGYNIL